MHLLKKIFFKKFRALKIFPSLSKNFLKIFERPTKFFFGFFEDFQKNIENIFKISKISFTFFHRFAMLLGLNIVQN